MGLSVEGFLRGVEEDFDLGFVGDVGLDGDGAWGGGGGEGIDLGDELVGVGLGGWGGVVDDEFSA